MEVAVDVRDERHGDKTRVPVHDALHVLDVDGPVTMLHDAQLETFGLERLVHVKRCLEMQLVEHDIPAAPGQIHAHDDDVLAVGRVLDKRDLVGFRTDELSEATLEVVLLFGAEVAAPLSGPFQTKRDVVRERPRSGQAHRMDCRGIQVDLV